MWPSLDAVTENSIPLAIQRLQKLKYPNHLEVLAWRSDSPTTHRFSVIKQNDVSVSRSKMKAKLDVICTDNCILHVLICYQN